MPCPALFSTKFKKMPACSCCKLPCWTLIETVCTFCHSPVLQSSRSTWLRKAASLHSHGWEPEICEWKTESYPSLDNPRTCLVAKCMLLCRQCKTKWWINHISLKDLDIWELIMYTTGWFTHPNNRLVRTCWAQGKKATKMGGGGSSKKSKIFYNAE